MPNQSSPRPSAKTIPQPRLHVVPGDVLTYASDVLCVLHVSAVPRLLWSMVDRGIIAASVPEKEPEAGGSELLSPAGALGAKKILLVESPTHRVDYEDIYKFGRGTLRALARRETDPKSLAMILHGPGYGLDTDMCFAQLVAGLREGLANHGPSVPSLQDIYIVEQQANRRDRMSKRAKRLWPHESATTLSATDEVAGTNKRPAPRIFVAMPFAAEFTDVWEYGFYNPAKDANCVCERCDRAVFDGDILDWIKERIRQADLVIAEVSTANPNVYLEIGYAWGLGKKTLLVSREAEALKFDIRNQRCILYKTIKELDSAIRSELPVHVNGAS